MASLRLLFRLDDAQQQTLAELLVNCVAKGAPVGFMHPLPLSKALAFWRGVIQAVGRGERALLVAEVAGQIVGTVQLVLAQPDNQTHRADISKMLVHSTARRLGLGAALLQAAEKTALQSRKTLLVLDTASDEAARLYARQGWMRVGVIPGFALMPTGEP